MRLGRRQQVLLVLVDDALVDGVGDGVDAAASVHVDADARVHLEDLAQLRLVAVGAVARRPARQPIQQPAATARPDQRPKITR